MFRCLPLLALVPLLAACSAPTRYAAPFFYNGSYYMAGDDVCRNILEVQQGRVVCRDANGQATGYRDAMTDQQLQMYQHNQQIAMMQAQAEQQFVAQMAQQNAMYAASMQPYQNPQTYLSSYAAPQVMPIQYGGNRISCISASLYTNCRY